MDLFFKWWLKFHNFYCKWCVKQSKIQHLICSGSKYFVTGNWFQRRLEYLITASKLKHKRLNAECFYKNYCFNQKDKLWSRFCKNLTLYFYLCTVISFREVLGIGFLCLKSSVLVGFVQKQIWSWSPAANFSLSYFLKLFLFEVVGNCMFVMKGDGVGI